MQRNGEGPTLNAGTVSYEGFRAEWPWYPETEHPLLMNGKITRHSATPNRDIAPPGAYKRSKTALPKPQPKGEKCYCATRSCLRSWCPRWLPAHTRRTDSR